MNKSVAISIFEDIKKSLFDDNAKQKGLSTVNLYIKGLEITQSEKFQYLINKQKESCQKYGANDRRTLKLNKKVDKELRNIYTN